MSMKRFERGLARNEPRNEDEAGDAYAVGAGMVRGDAPGQPAPPEVDDEELRPESLAELPELPFTD